MRRATVRHLTIRAAKVTNVAGTFASAKVTNVVAGAVAADGELANVPGEVVTDALPVGARALTWADLEAVWTLPEVAEPALEPAPDALCAL